MKQMENEMNVNVPLEVIKASEIEPKEVKWLWYPYIPFGKVTLLQGDPGDGKSKLMLSVAALLSKGEALPFTDEEIEPMTIIYQTTEDDADDTVVPRFNSASGNGENLIFIKEDEKSLSFGDNRIAEAIEKYHAKLLILDPMSSYIGENCSMNNANETRAEQIRAGIVDPTSDNMLKITNDGRKLALDQRLMNDMLADEEGTKVDTCANNVFEIWRKTSEFKGTQLVFCDSSTPKKDGNFNVYDDIRSKLISKGVPESDIAFIHDADNDVKKKELFAKVRRGDVRILLGSTQKMGAGTNVQTRLYASHDLDCPWRPSDLEQRAGRIIRQGNTNDTVHIYRYVTKDTFDSYSYQLVENKQKFISQIMTSKSPVRSADDIDETALSYAEIKALATGNPHIKEKMELDTEVAKLKLLKSSFMTQKYELENKLIKYYPREIKKLSEMIECAEKDKLLAEKYPKKEDIFHPMKIDGTLYSEKEQAGQALIERCKAMTSVDPVMVGEYRGFKMILSIDTFANEHKMTLQGSRSYSFPIGTSVFGNIQRMDNAIENIPKFKDECEQKLEETKQQFEIAKTESKNEFPREEELAEKIQRLAALDALLSMDKRRNDVIDVGEPDESELPKRKIRVMER